MTSSLTVLINDSSSSFLANNSKFKKFKKPNIDKNFYQKLFHYFLLNDQDELPIAAVCALVEGYPAAQGWWLRADPVQLYADLSHVYLLGNQHLDFSAEEVNQLLADLNQFLKEDNLQLIAANKTEWYLRLAREPEIKTFPLPEVVGKIITNYLPQGNQASYWQKLLTETQMLLVMNTVNKKRLNENKSIINSLWFWGGGALPKVTQKPNWKKVYCNDNLTKGLSLLTAVSFADVEYLQQNERGDYLLVTDNVTSGFLAQIGKKKFTKIILDFAKGDCFEFGSNQLRSWWQRIF